MKIYVNCNQPFPGMGTKACPFQPFSRRQTLPCRVMKCWLPPALSGGCTSSARRQRRKPDYLPRRSTGAECDYRGRSAVTVGRMRLRHLETVIPNDVLGEDNPFADLISGDWYYDDAAEPVHRADIYLDNRSLREVFTREALLAAEPSPYAWDTEFSRNVWMSERTETETTLYLHLLCGSPDGHLWSTARAAIASTP